MKQIFAPYPDWEDYINGMYVTTVNNESELIESAILVLSNCDLFLKVCLDIISNWKVSTSVNLTNKQCNRKAWLGQAACCYKFGVPEICTRIAWSRLTEAQRIAANIVAEKVIRIYEAKNNKLHSSLGESLLF